MNVKKMGLLVISLFIFLCCNTDSVLAICDGCSPGGKYDCEYCGCIENNSGTACIYPNIGENSFQSCGDGYITEIPGMVPKVISIIYTVVQIAVPVVLVIFGMLDLMKGISAQKEDEIKKGQQILIKRLISAALVFFVFAIVKIIISVAADGTQSKILECAECFLTENCD